MSYFEFKDSDIIRTKYVAYPSYTLNMTNFISEGFFVFNSSSIKTERSYTDINGFSVTGSFNMSGCVTFVQNSSISDSEKYSINRLRNIYASSSFERPYSYTSSSLYSSANPISQTMHIVNIPSLLYGSEVKPGSFRLETNTGHVYTDDSYGGLYTGSSLVGCVFYQHGIAYFGHNFNSTGLLFTTCSFSGTSVVPVSIYMCTIPRGALNFSNNPSYSMYISSSNKNEITTKNPKTFVTGIAFMDRDFKIVGTAKVSTPILNEEDSSMVFRVKVQF